MHHSVTGTNLIVHAPSASHKNPTVPSPSKNCMLEYPHPAVALISLLSPQVFALSIDLRTVKFARSVLLAGLENHTEVLPARSAPWQIGLTKAPSCWTFPKLSPGRNRSSQPGGSSG